MEYLSLRNFDIKTPEENEKEYSLFQDIKSDILYLIDKVIQENQAIPYEINFTLHIQKENEKYKCFPYGNVSVYNTKEMRSSPKNKVYFLMKENNIYTFKEVDEKKIIYSAKVIVQKDIAFISYWKHNEYISQTNHYYILPLNKNHHNINKFQFFHSSINELTNETETKELLEKEDIFTKIAKTLEENETRLLYLPEEEKQNIANSHQILDFRMLFKKADLTPQEIKIIETFCYYIYQFPKMDCIFLRRYRNHILLIKNKILKKSNDEKYYRLFAEEKIIAHKTI